MMSFLAYRIYELNILMVKEDEAGRVSDLDQLIDAKVQRTKK